MQLVKEFDDCTHAPVCVCVSCCGVSGYSRPVYFSSSSSESLKRNEDGSGDSEEARGYAAIGEMRGRQRSAGDRAAEGTVTLSPAVSET